MLFSFRVTVSVFVEKWDYWEYLPGGKYGLIFASGCLYILGSLRCRQVHSSNLFNFL